MSKKEVKFNNLHETIVGDFPELVGQLSRIESESINNPESVTATVKEKLNDKKFDKYIGKLAKYCSYLCGGHTSKFF